VEAPTYETVVFYKLFRLEHVSLIWWSLFA